ncbi:MAG TPA: hypothetical protein VLK59_00630, partial [Solirubrobacteraceae bacterium]|nr:hypothetical protein [Solirubrobacteraceae bacterium]
MTLALRPSLMAPTVPDGIVLHDLDVAADAGAIHAADAIAFADNPEFHPESLEAFTAEHIQAPEIDPGLSPVARRGGSIAGFALCQRRIGGRGYIDG